MPNDPDLSLTLPRALRPGLPGRQAIDGLPGASAEQTPILDLFEIGKAKNNRPIELIFVER